MSGSAVVFQHLGASSAEICSAWVRHLGSLGVQGVDLQSCPWSDLQGRLKPSFGDGHRSPAALYCPGEWNKSSCGSGCPERLHGLRP